MFLPRNLTTALLSLLSLIIACEASGFRNNLLFSESDLPRMRANTENPIFKAYWEEELEKDIEEDGNFRREALIYILTGDAERGEVAREYTMEMVRRDRWHRFQDADGTPIGFLRAARKTARVSLAYDWLYDLFTPEEREEILTAIADKGCQPIYNGLHGMKHPESVIRWDFVPDDFREGQVLDMSRWPEILSKNNFRAVMNGGLALGLYTVGDRDPRSETWEEILLESIPYFNSLFKDDGSYDEAVSYVNYAMKFQIHAMEVVRRKRGIDFFDTANFTGLTDFVLAMYLPSHAERHGSVSFGDAGPSLQSSTAFWTARRARDGLSQYLGLKHADHYWSALFYYDPTVTAIPPPAGADFVNTDLDWIIARTGHEVEDAVVAMRSGGPMNHEHADRNSIIFKAYGEVLLSDPGKVTYDPRSPEWVLRTAKGHNMILIDGEGIQYHEGQEGTNESLSSAKILRYGERRGYSFWASDATPGYRLVNPDVEGVTRTVIFIPEAPCLVILDKVTKSEEPSLITARWHLENRDDKGGMTLQSAESFHFTRPEARLQVTTAGTQDVVTSEGEFDFPDNPIHYRYADVKTTEESRDTFLVTVATALRPDEPDPEVDITNDGTTWKVDYNKQGSELDIRIHDRGNLPEFEVERNDFLW
ncbi:MAG: heparinase II/III family protein [Oceanipulchritudo sp.]